MGAVAKGEGLKRPLVADQETIGAYDIGLGIVFVDKVRFTFRVRFNKDIASVPENGVVG